MAILITVATVFHPIRTLAPYIHTMTSHQYLFDFPPKIVLSFDSNHPVGKATFELSHPVGEVILEPPCGPRL